MLNSKIQGAFSFLAWFVKYLSSGCFSQQLRTWLALKFYRLKMQKIFNLVFYMDKNVNWIRGESLDNQLIVVNILFDSKFCTVVTYQLKLVFWGPRLSKKSQGWIYLSSEKAEPIVMAWRKCA